MFQRNNILREQFEDSVKGKQVIIPDIQSLLSDWPQGLHPYVQKLRENVDQHLSNWFEPGKGLAKLKAGEVGVFGAMWWPYADYEALKTATYLSIFLFAWDDGITKIPDTWSRMNLTLILRLETDSTEVSLISENFALSQKMRDDTIVWVSHCLGFEPVVTPPPSNPLIRNFASIGDHLRRNYDSWQRESILQYIKHYVEQCGIEQQSELRNQLPTLPEYRRRRMGSSGVFVALSMTSLCYNIRPPRFLEEDPGVAQLWEAANVIISNSNDILSLPKEIAAGQVSTVVPLLFNELGSVQEAIDVASKEIELACQDFESTGAALLQKYGNCEARNDLEKIILGCQYACTANVNWSLRSKRYNLGLKTLQGGASIKLI